LRDIQAELAASGRGLLDEIADTAGFAPGIQYPAGEVWDRASHAQYFYHAHPEGERVAGEHGHFHLFLGQGGMPPGMAPFVLPEMALAPLMLPVRETGDPGTHRSARDRGVFSHLIAISVDGAGQPLALFTTNRWVTGETWYRADDVIDQIDRFDLVEPGPRPCLDRWLVACLGLLRPWIVDLVRARDAAIMDWRRRRSRNQHVFEDRRLEVASITPIDFPAELAAALR
jgi:hypothetical protein